MKKYLLFLSICGLFAVSSCTNTNNTNDANSQQQTTEVTPPTIKDTELYYNLDSGLVFKVAEPIIYEVVVKNHKADDDWEAERLDKTYIRPLANAIFQAVYKGRLKAYDYFSEAEMSIDEVKDLEKKFNRDNIGNIMFEENWYFDETLLKFYKKINALTFGYELYDPDTKEFQGFKAAFKVNLQ